MHINPSVFAISLIFVVFSIKNVLFFTEREECLVPPVTVPDSTATSWERVVVDFTYGNFLSAVSISAASDGSLFVLDEGNNKLIEFAANGSLVKNIGGKGWGNLEFDQPTDVCASFPLDIYVADYNNRRIQRFDRRMNLVQSINADNIVPTLSGAFYPRASALSTQGELFVVESDGRRILKFNPAQQLEREFGSFNAGAGALLNPRDIAITPEGKVIVLDEHRIVEFDTYANYLSSIQLDSLIVPLSVSVAANGLLVVDANRVIVYSLDGIKRYEVARQSLIGGETIDEFRDAVVTGSTLYILTSHALIVTKINP